MARSLLLEDAVPLLTLTGPGGVGKTRLALAIVTDVASHFADGVIWVDLAPLTDPELVSQTVAGALGVTLEPEASVEQQLARYLRPWQCLLLLDNCEHVLVRTAALVSHLIRACPALQVLATSRAPLKLHDEHEFLVEPLPTPSSAGASIETLQQNAAVRLFLERTRAVRPGFRLDEANAAPIVAVGRRLDGLPLAIELAAARGKLLSPEALLAQMTQRLRILSDGPRDLPARQQTIAATIAWSYGLLSADEQVIFRRLSVFSGRFTLAAARAIAFDSAVDEMDVLRSLTTLADQSLVQRMDSATNEPRFRMLETIRDFGREQLAQRGEAEPVKTRHAIWFRDLAERAEPLLIGAEQHHWFRCLDGELDNMRAALAWAYESEQPEIALRLASALSEFWDVRGLCAEGLGWLERGLASAPPGSERSKALLIAGKLALWQGDVARATALCEACLELARTLGEGGVAALALGVLALEADARGEGRRAEELLAEAIGLLHRSDDAWAMSQVLYDLSLVARNAGDLDRAEAYLEEMLAIATGDGDTRSVTFALLSLAVNARDRGDRQRSRQLAEEYLGLAQDVGDRMRIAVAVSWLGLLAVDAGDLPRSASLLKDAAEIVREIDARGRLSELLEMMAKTASAAGHAATACRLLGAAEAQREAFRRPTPRVDRDEQDRDVAAVRAALTPETFKSDWGAGHRLSWDQALALLSAAATEVVSRDELSSAALTGPSLAPEAGFDLTPREQDVLTLLCQRLTDFEIAERLFISPRTVGTHVGRVIDKLGAANRRDAAAIAARRGWV